MRNTSKEGGTMGLNFGDWEGDIVSAYPEASQLPDPTEWTHIRILPPDRIIDGGVSEDDDPRAMVEGFIARHIDSFGKKGKRRAARNRRHAVTAARNLYGQVIAEELLRGEEVWDKHLEAYALAANEDDANTAKLIRGVWWFFDE